jgi:hypothetical protein
MIGRTGKTKIQAKLKLKICATSMEETLVTMDMHTAQIRNLQQQTDVLWDFVNWVSAKM